MVRGIIALLIIFWAIGDAFNVGGRYIHLLLIFAIMLTLTQFLVGGKER